MKEWSTDFINGYLSKHHKGKVVCKLCDAKGRILISQKAFPQGAIVFEETPLQVIVEDPDAPAFKKLQMVCERDPDTFTQAPLWYWSVLCSLTADQLGPAKEEFQLVPVTAEHQQMLLCLYHEPVNKASIAAKRLVQLYNLDVSPILLDELLWAWIFNCFEFSDNPKGMASYFAASFMSHSCLPNAIWHLAEGTEVPNRYVLRARQRIEVGDEVCIAYLSELALLQSSAERRKKLQKSKQFHCTCERCGPDAVDADSCRGFRCPHCGKSTVFHPGPIKNQTLEKAVCSVCQEEVGAANSKLLLAAESSLRAKVRDLKAQRHKMCSSLNDSDIQQLLRAVGDSEAGIVGPQHWLCNDLWDFLSTWYDKNGRQEDARRMIRLQVDYHRNAYPGTNANLAWTLDKLGTMLLRHVDECMRCSMHDLDKAEFLRVAAQAAPIFEEAVRILTLFFGDKHKYSAKVEAKRVRLQKFLETGQWPAGKWKASKRWT